MARADGQFLVVVADLEAADRVSSVRSASSAVMVALTGGSTNGLCRSSRRHCRDDRGADEDGADGRWRPCHRRARPCPSRQSQKVPLTHEKNTDCGPRFRLERRFGQCPTGSAGSADVLPERAAVSPRGRPVRDRRRSHLCGPALASPVRRGDPISDATMSLRVFISPIGLALAAAALFPPRGGHDTASVRPRPAARARGPRRTRPGSARRARGAATSGSRSSRGGPARSSIPTCPRRASATSSSSSPTAGRSPTGVDRHAAPGQPSRRAQPRLHRRSTPRQSGRYRLTKRVVTDPARDARAGPGGAAVAGRRTYQLFVLHDPALANDGIRRPRPAPRARRWSPTTAQVATAPAVPTGLQRDVERPARRDDGWTDLKDDHRLDHRHDSAGPGNVVQTGRVGRRDRTRRAPGRDADPRLRPDRRGAAEHRAGRPPRRRSGGRRRATTAAGTATSSR